MVNPIDIAGNNEEEEVYLFILFTYILSYLSIFRETSEGSTVNEWNMSKQGRTTKSRRSKRNSNWQNVQCEEELKHAEMKTLQMVGFPH